MRERRRFIKQLHLEDGHEQYNFRTFCRRIASIDVAKNGAMSAGKGVAMMAKTKEEKEGTPVTFSQFRLILAKVGVRLEF